MLWWLHTLGGRLFDHLCFVLPARPWLWRRLLKFKSRGLKATPTTVMDVITSSIDRLRQRVSGQLTIAEQRALQPFLRPGIDGRKRLTQFAPFFGKRILRSNGPSRDDVSID